jgi:hypothetical protein
MLVGFPCELYQNSIRDLGFLISIFNSFFLKFTLIELVNDVYGLIEIHSRIVPDKAFA